MGYNYRTTIVILFNIVQDLINSHDRVICCFFSSDSDDVIYIFQCQFLFNLNNHKRLLMKRLKVGVRVPNYG